MVEVKEAEEARMAKRAKQSMPSTASTIKRWVRATSVRNNIETQTLHFNIDGALGASPMERNVASRSLYRFDT